MSRLYAQFLMAAVRWRQSVTVSKIETHLGCFDVVIRFQTERQKLPDRHAERPLTQHRSTTSQYAWSCGGTVLKTGCLIAPYFVNHSYSFNKKV